LADVGSVAGLASAVVVMSAAYNDPPLATVLAAGATVGAVWVAIDTRQPLRLWIAAGFAALAAVSLGRWLQPSEELRPVAIAAAALLLFIPAYLPRFRANGFARVTPEIPIAAGLAGATAGLGFRLAHPCNA